MDIPEPDFAVTPYGDVDAKALEELRQSFDTSALLALSDQLDVKRIAELRDEMLKLHRMAHTVINGAELSERPGDDLWEMADDLIDRLNETAEAYQEIATAIEPLAGLRPRHLG